MIEKQLKQKDQLKNNYLFQLKKGEGTNALADAAPYTRTINNRVENKLISKEERAVEAILAAGTELDITSALTAAADAKAKREVIQDAFVESGRTIEDKVDEFKYSTEAVAIYHTRIGKAFSKTQGQDYTQGTNTFGDAFQGGFNFQDLDFLPETILKSIPATGGANDDTDKIVIGIVMAQDAYADAGLENGHQEVNESLIRKDVVGHIYDDLNVVVDSARITKIVASIASLKAAGILGSQFKVEAKVNA